LSPFFFSQRTASFLPLSFESVLSALSPGQLALLFNKLLFPFCRRTSTLIVKVAASSPPYYHESSSPPLLFLQKDGRPLTIGPRRTLPPPLNRGVRIFFFLLFSPPRVSEFLQSYCEEASSPDFSLFHEGIPNLPSHARSRTPLRKRIAFLPSPPSEAGLAWLLRRLSLPVDKILSFFLRSFFGWGLARSTPRVLLDSAPPPSFLLS